MQGQSNAGGALLDVRRLAAIDMYGRHGGTRRRRLILAGVDVPAELRRYAARQLFIGIPLLVLVLGTAQAAVRRRSRDLTARTRDR